MLSDISTHSSVVIIRPDQPGIGGMVSVRLEVCTHESTESVRLLRLILVMGVAPNTGSPLVIVSINTCFF